MSSFQRRALLIILLIGTGVWYYLFGVFLPYEKDHEPPGVSRTNRSDLYPRWLGARELILRGRNPYSATVTRDIQLGYYGQTIERGSFTKDEQRFAYPAYVVFFLAPTVKLPFSSVNEGFELLLFGFTIASVELWIRALRLKFSRFTRFLCVLAVLASWPVAEGLYTRQLSLLVAFLLACACEEIATGRLRVAGVCLASSMIKPQLALLLISSLLIWAAGNWRNRQSLVWSLVTTTGILVLGAEIVLPHWIRYWWNSLHGYVAYTGSQPSLERLFGSIPGFVLELILIAVVLAICWRFRKHRADSEGFGFVLCLILSTTLTLLPTWSLASYNEVLLIPAALWLCSVWKNRELRRTQSLGGVFAACVLAWEPLTICLISIASLAPGVVITQSILRVPLYLYFLVPAVVTVVTLLTIGIRDGWTLPDGRTHA